MITISRVADLGRLTRVENLSGVTFTGEDEGHKFVITAMLDDAIVPLTGSVSGKFIRPGGYTVALTQAEGYAGIEDGKAWVSLAGNCYTEAGPFGLTITHIDGEKRTVIYACAGYVRPGETSSIVDPESLINVDAIAGMLADLQEAIEEAEGITDVVDELKSEIEAQELLIGGESDNLHNNSTDVVGEFYNSTGAVEAETSTKKYWKRTALIDIGEYDSVTFSGGTASLSKKNVFVGSDGTTVVKVFDTVSTGTVHVPEGAKYVGFSLNKATTNFSCVGVYNGTINDRIDALEPTVEVLESIENNGYGDLLDKSWARGGWLSGSFSVNIKYRAGINVKLTTDKDLELLAKRGFQLLGEAKINGVTVSSTGNFSCMFYVPAGAEYILTVRRITENSSEQLTDAQVREFAAAVMVTNVRGSDYLNYRHTFTGFEMFESMAIIGDSYSAGNNTNNWGKCLGRMIGTDITVWARSGDKTSDWIVHFMPSMLAAEPKGLYWLNLGINDGATVKTTPAYLGSSADVDETTYPDVDDFPNTFWGNYGRIIRNIQIHAPNAKLILEKTLFANMRNAQADGESSATLTINNAIGDIAEHYGLPCIDQLDDAFYTSEEYANSMTTNHPRAYTWPGMANANRRLFAKAVFDNPEYFY